MSEKYDRKDHFYRQAKESGHRSRAAYKLIEINKKHRLLRRGQRVIDLGAWPGGWMQVAGSAVGPEGLVVGIDLQAIDPFDYDNMKTITGDVRADESIAAALKLADGRFDLLICDMSPKLTGVKSVDRIAAVACAELALWAAQQLLVSGGAVIIKLFKSNEAEEFVRDARSCFNRLVRMELRSTRKTSNEFYAVGFGFKLPDDSQVV